MSMRREYFYTNHYDLMAEFSHCADCNQWSIETKQDFRREFDFFEDMLKETEQLMRENPDWRDTDEPDNDDGYMFFSSSLLNIDGAYARHHYDPELFKDVERALSFYEKRYAVTLH